MKPYETLILSEDKLKASGINLEAFGITNRKNRPYMVVASNRQMTWLVPLTTVMKHAHGRIAVWHVTKNGGVDCEAITTDMFSISTKVLENLGIPRGRVMGGKDVASQLQYSIGCGRLGVYPR